jgi:hypothetical protein
VAVCHETDVALCKPAVCRETDVAVCRGMNVALCKPAVCREVDLAVCRENDLAVCRDKEQRWWVAVCRERETMCRGSETNAEQGPLYVRRYLRRINLWDRTNSKTNRVLCEPCVITCRRLRRK